MKKLKLIVSSLLLMMLCNQPVFSQTHRVRMQIQGDDIKNDISDTWNNNHMMSKKDAVEMLTNLWNKLNSTQKEERSDAFDKARDYISNAPAKGISNQGSKSFQKSNRSISNARIDIEINSGAAFCNDRNIVYIRITGSDLSSSQSWTYDEQRVSTKSESLDALERLWRNISSEQQKARNDAYKDAVSFIKNAGVNGVEGSNFIKEFKDSNAKSNEKIVITIDKGAAFSD